MRLDPFGIFNKRNYNKFWNYQVRIKFPIRWIGLLFKKNK